MNTKQCRSKPELSDDEEDFFPALPPHMMPKLEKPFSRINQESNENEEDIDMYCPALPPHLIKTNSNDPKMKKVVGPSLPDNYIPPIIDKFQEESISSESDIEENEVVGPLPDCGKEDSRFNEEEILLRAKILREGTKKDDGKLARESWMLELPTDKPNILALGLGARQFRKKAVEYGDRTVWTDTPEDIERKTKLLKSQDKEEDTIVSAASQRRDEELTEMVNEFTESKRSVPLIESHSKKRRREEEPKTKERKPFTRDDDLCVNKFDEAQKKSILKKARQLNDRFSAGKQKFL